MSEYFYGRVGKNDGWGLLSDRPIVVWSKQKGEFYAFDSLKEADETFVNSSENQAYFWDNGEWKPVDFFVPTGGGKAIKGFSPK